MQVLTTAPSLVHRYARGSQRSARGDLAGIARSLPGQPVLDRARVGAHDRRDRECSSMQVLTTAPRPSPQVRTIDAVVPIVTFATRFVVAGASPKQVRHAEL